MCHCVCVCVCVPGLSNSSARSKSSDLTMLIPSFSLLAAMPCRGVSPSSLEGAARGPQEMRGKRRESGGDTHAPSVGQMIESETAPFLCPHRPHYTSNFLLVTDAARLPYPYRHTLFPISYELPTPPVSFRRAQLIRRLYALHPLCSWASGNVPKKASCPPNKQYLASPRDAPT